MKMLVIYNFYIKGEFVDAQQYTDVEQAKAFMEELSDRFAVQLEDVSVEVFDTVY